MLFTGLNQLFLLWHIMHYQYHFVVMKLYYPQVPPDHHTMYMTIFNDAPNWLRVGWAKADLEIKLCFAGMSM
jgi:spore maturation protein SpmA